MNKKQLYTLIVCFLIVAVSLIIWIAYGGEIFSKTQVIVEKKDPLFGFTERQWVNKFVWGLDLSLLISGVSIFAAALLCFLFSDKPKSSELS
jgi:hypothetical protein